MFKVYKKRCNQCLFSKNRIVSLRRASEVISECVKNDSYFICHKSSIESGEVCCKGFYDKFGDYINLIRIAKQLNGVQFVNNDNT